MGYRLDAYLANDESKWVGFGKFYGYVGVCYRDLKKLASYRYLLEIGKIDKSWVFADGLDTPQIVLNAEEFRKFATLYLEDWKKEYQVDLLFSYQMRKCIDDMMKDPNDKILVWG